MSIRVRCKECTRPQIIIYNNDYCESDTDTDSDTEPEWDPRDSDTESGTETELDSESEVSDSEDGSDYESESEAESDSESLDDPKPYYGKGFRVYFDSKEDKRFFMRAFGFNT
jgi:hypothetical protein